MKLTASAHLCPSLDHEILSPLKQSLQQQIILNNIKFPISTGVLGVYARIHCIPSSQFLSVYTHLRVKNTKFVVITWSFQTQNGPKSGFARTQSWTPLVELTMLSSPRSPSLFGMGTPAGAEDIPTSFPSKCSL